MSEETSFGQDGGMSFVTPGFGGSRRKQQPDLPPGQYLAHDFPVLSAGPTPRVRTDRWEFVITTETGDERKWTWAGFTPPPSEDGTCAIHCVTKRSNRLRAC